MKRLVSITGPLQFFLLACLSFSLLFASDCAPVATAQQRGPVQRVVQGKVESNSGAALSGAVVYLKDSHTLAVKTFIADANGAYRFGQLAQNTDYALWAELSGKKSKEHSISSFDTKNDFTIDLKIDTGK